MFIHLLDLFFMLNFCASAFFAIVLDEHSVVLFYIAVILLAIAFITFIGILMYHVYLVFIKVKMSSKLANIRKNEKKGSVNSFSLLQSFSGTVGDSMLRNEKFDKLREPILSYIEDDEDIQFNWD